MANNPSILPGYNGQTVAPNASYTYGSARDDAAPGDLTGTPRIAAEINDIMGFQQALLNKALIVPSGTPDTVLVSQYLEAITLLQLRQSTAVFLTVALMQAGTSVTGPIMFFDKMRISTGGTEWEVTTNVTSYPLAGGLFAQKATIAGIFDFGLNMGGGVDVVPTIQAALNSMPEGGEYILPASDFVYDFDTELVIPAQTSFNSNNQRCSYSGILYAITCGTSDTVLTEDVSAINLRLKLTNKDGKGVRLRGTRNCKVTGYLEGDLTDFATRTNIGLDIDGVDVSTFANHITLFINHMHESIRIGTTGTVQATAQHFTDCYLLGDQDDDITSIGYNFQDSPVGAYDGTTIVGGNIEKVNTSIIFGNFSQQISVDTRFESADTATSRKLIFGTDTGGIRVRGAGLDIALIGAVNGGIVGFGGTSNSLEDRKGNTRTNGNDSSFAGIPTPISAIGTETFLYKENGDVRWRSRDIATGTGVFTFQPGAISATFGAYLQLNGHAHASSPGDYRCGFSQGSGGNFAVTSGLSGTERLVVDDSTVRPGTNNAILCGTGSFSWSGGSTQVAFTVTSDADYKTEPKPITDEVLDAWYTVEFCSFKLLASIEEKGWDKARMHFGVIAQQVKKAFEDAGLNAFDYALLCWDEWEDQYSNIPETYTGKSTIIPEVLDEKGNVIEEEKEVMEIDAPAHKKLVEPAGSRYGIRYEQALILEAALMRRELQRIKENLV